MSLISRMIIVQSLGLGMLVNFGAKKCWNITPKFTYSFTNYYTLPFVIFFDPHSISHRYFFKGIFGVWHLDTCVTFCVVETSIRLVTSCQDQYSLMVRSQVCSNLYGP
jgi:hypothetical protein